MIHTEGQPVFCTLEEAFELSLCHDRAKFLEKTHLYLVQGKLTASGLPDGTGQRAEIPRLAWIDCRLAFGLGGWAIHEKTARERLGKFFDARIPIIGPAEKHALYPAPKLVLADSQRAYGGALNSMREYFKRPAPAPIPATVAWTDIRFAAKEIITIWLGGTSKQDAALETIKRIGIDLLFGLSQKERETRIIEDVRAMHGLSISARTVRSIWTKSR